MQDDFDYSSCDRDGVAAPSIRGEQFGSNRIKSNYSQVEVGGEVEGVIGIIESRTFLRECIRRSMQSSFQATIVTYSDFSEFENEIGHSRPSVILLPLVDGTVEGAKQSLNNLSELVPNVPVIVICYKNDSELVRTAITHGAKGYIPATMGFDIAVEAVRFVLAGGTYVPVDYFFTTGWSGPAPSERPATLGKVTARELAVVRAIQQGKPNKIIAYELNMCESTVKVHVRSIMKKLKAKNRTDVAIKSSQLPTCPRCVGQGEC